MTFAERDFVKKQKFEQNTYLFFNYRYAFWRRLLSEFYYPDEIVTENEGNVEVLSISRALPIRSHIINNLLTLFALALL